MTDVAKEFAFSILAKFRDMASSGLRSLGRTLKSTAGAAAGGLMGFPAGRPYDALRGALRRRCNGGAQALHRP